MTDQIAHTLCNQRAYSGEDSSRESERRRNQLLGLLGQLRNDLQEEKVRNHNLSLFIHRDRRTGLIMSVECFEDFGTEAFY